MPDSRKTREMGRLFAMSQVGMEMVGMLGIGLLADYYFHTMPWCTIIGMLAGFVGGITHLVVLASPKRKDEDEAGKGAG